MNQTSQDPPDETTASTPPADRAATATLKPLTPPAMLRSAIAGMLMGIANLIPGVSGGTMILAMGVYQEFIDSVADVTALRFSRRRLVFLAIVGVCAAVSILGLAGVILYLLFHYTVAMFALFIGLTLGGAPLLARSLRPIRADVVIAVVVGFAAMTGVAFLKAGTGFPHGPLMDVVSGLVGATTMVLPGISGSYMLLIMDQYDRVVGAVRDLKEALRGADVGAMTAALKIVVPVGIGAVVGIVALSNLLKVLLHRFHRATVGALLGILLGSVIGLWPFTQSVGHKALEVRSVAELRAYAARWQLPGVETIHADNTEAERDALVAHITDPTVWAKRTNPPIQAGEAGLAIVMVLAGFGVTFALSRLGDGGEPA